MEWLDHHACVFTEPFLSPRLPFYRLELLERITGNSCDVERLLLKHRLEVRHRFGACDEKPANRRILRPGAQEQSRVISFLQPSPMRRYDLLDFLERHQIS